MKTGTTVRPVPPGYPAEIVGYAEPWIASPGDTISAKVSQQNLKSVSSYRSCCKQISCTEPEYTYKIVRLIQGHRGDNFPPHQEEIIQEISPQSRKGRFQLAQPGSYALVEGINKQLAVDHIEGLAVSVCFRPHLPEAGKVQTLLSTLDESQCSGFALSLSREGRVRVTAATDLGIQTIETDYTAAYAEWVEARITFYPSAGEFDLNLDPMPGFAHCASRSPLTLQRFKLQSGIDLFRTDRLSLAAQLTGKEEGTTYEPTEFFNGRLARVCFEATMNDDSKLTVAQFDFLRDVNSDRIFDKSKFRLHGQLVNAPTRAVTDHEWDGHEQDWTKAQYGYGAIHFHADDLDDAAWETDFTFTMPEKARSGAYAIKIESSTGTASDDVVFFIRPSMSPRPDVKVALVLSTFTYLAYGNERMYDQSKPSRMEAPNEKFAIRKDDQFYRMERRVDLGLSCYDVHEDGSGVIYSSPRRPLLAVRPDYINWAMWRPREFSADLLMIAFLERLGESYDVITDHDLHFAQQHPSRVDLNRYQVLITGCHPEYPTMESLNTYTEFAQRGGSIMYLGGNGFYWVAAMSSSSEAPEFERLEVRRGDQGVRSYTLPGGELHFSTNGQRGGLWRSRGRSPNVLFGVGTAGEGTGPGVPYERTAISKSAPYSWMFEGIESDLIGVEGFGGGASGDEIDKFDILNGSPSNAIVLATSTGHSDEFGIFPEDCGFPLRNTCGTQTKEIRSDMVHYRTKAGGTIFSVGSINWLCSLGWQGFDNDVARLTSNVLYHLLGKSE